MKQTIEIEVPEGKEAIWKDSRVLFIDKPIELPKTWEEYCKVSSSYKYEYFIGTNAGIVTHNIGDEKNPDFDRNLLATKEDAKAHLALIQLHRLRDCYRQGWKPDYLDDSRKWCIIKFNNNFCIDYRVHYSLFLSFQTREIAEEFLNNFRDLIEQARDLI